MNAAFAAFGGGMMAQPRPQVVVVQQKPVYNPMQPMMQQPVYTPQQPMQYRPQQPMPQQQMYGGMPQQQQYGQPRP